MLQSAWAYNNGKRIMNESKETIKKIEAEKMHQRAKNRIKLEKQRTITRLEKKKAFETIWDGLKKGDSLLSLNLPNVVIKKKNKKSIQTETCKYTKKEILNLWW